MRIPEYDLDAIRRLLTRSEWLATGCSEADARRWTAAVALAWYCGAQVKEMARMTLADWRPGDVDAVMLPPPPKEPGVRPHRTAARLVPLLEPARFFVGALAEDVAAQGAGGALFAAPGGTAKTGPRGALEALGRRMSAISGGAAPSLADLRRRFASYLSLSGADPACAAWLSATTAPRHRGGRVAPPTQDELRKALAAAHPLPRAERSMWREGGQR